MRLLPGMCVSLAGALLTTALAAQGLAPKPPAFQHITVAASPDPAARKGGTVTLWADVTPRVGVHVYAANPHGFTPVKLVLTPNRVFTAGRTEFPVAEMAPTLGVSEPVAVYRKTFRITQPVTIAASATPGETIRIAGAVNYQACDERLCYPPSSVPVTWSVAIQ